MTCKTKINHIRGELRKLSMPSISDRIDPRVGHPSACTYMYMCVQKTRCRKIDLVATASTPSNIDFSSINGSAKTGENLNMVVLTNINWIDWKIRTETGNLRQFLPKNWRNTSLSLQKILNNWKHAGCKQRDHWEKGMRHHGEGRTSLDNKRCCRKTL